ncbi:hypothetical protein ACTSKR_09515 [Chitinibacteraceae bacterium HSL-7]
MQTMQQVFADAGTWAMAIAMRQFYLLDCSGPVTVRFYRYGQEVARAENVEAGYWMRSGEGFERFEVDTGAGRVKVGVSASGEGGYNRTAGEVSAAIKGGAAVLNRPLLNVGTTESVAAVANGDRVALRFWNTGTTNIYIGGAGLSIADAALKLQPGDLWNETDAPAAAWVALSDAVGGVLKVQEVTR